MSGGYVYVLSNPYMPGVVKIGHSNRSGRIRAAEIYTTGVPGPFKLEFELFTEDCRELELIVHEKLQRSRVSESREFFRVDVAEATVEIMDQYAGGLDFRVLHADEIVEPADLAHACHLLTERGHDLYPPDAGELYGYLEIDDLEKALRKLHASRADRKISGGSR